MSCFYNLHIDINKCNFRNFKLVDDNTTIILKNKKTKVFDKKIKIIGKKFDGTMYDLITGIKFSDTTKYKNYIPYIDLEELSTSDVIDQLYQLSSDDRLNYTKAIQKILKSNTK